MATSEIQTLLVEVVPAQKARTPASIFGDPQIGARHGCRQSHLCRPLIYVEKPNGGGERAVLVEREVYINFCESEVS
jgi:hypothetical protein